MSEGNTGTNEAILWLKVTNKWGNSVTKADEEIRNFMTKGDE